MHRGSHERSLRPRSRLFVMHDLAGVCVQEAERSLHDALCVIRCLVHKRFMIAGGAAAEVEVATQLSRWAKTLVVCPTSTYLLTIHLSTLWMPDLQHGHGVTHRSMAPFF